MDLDLPIGIFIGRTNLFGQGKPSKKASPERQMHAPSLILHWKENPGKFLFEISFSMINLLVVKSSF